MVNVNRSWSASLVLLAAVSAVGCGSVVSDDDDDDVDVVEDNADGEPGETGEADEAGEAAEEGAEGAADGDADGDAAADDADADADADGDVDTDADADVCSDGYLDPVSGLCWWRGLEDPFVSSMEEAASRCAAEGRRVPTIGELRTLVRGCPASEPGGSCPEDATYCDGCPRLPPWDCLWPPEMGTWTCDPNGYLSSTPSGDPAAPALCLSFGAANIHPCDPDDPYLSGLAVICVREGG